MKFIRKLDYETRVGFLGATVIDFILLVDFLKILPLQDRPGHNHRIKNNKV